MKKELFKYLACPKCKGEMEIEITLQDVDEIVEGRLRCMKCNLNYEIEKSVPILIIGD